ncbi:MAG: dihydroorotase [Prochlorotrichaceae cyanobacterium]|jgi:dihydroorotase
MKWELLQQVTLLDWSEGSASERVVDVLLQQVPKPGGTALTWCLDRIAPQLEEIPSDTLIYDAQGWFLGPSFVDLYSHSGEPGFEERETLLSLSQAAQAGGFSQVHLLPQTKPPLDTPALIAQIEGGNLERSVQLHCWGSLSQQCQGQRMTEFGELLAAGCAGLSEAGPIQDWTLLQRSLEYLKPVQCPIALWPSHPQFPGMGKAREGYLALQLGLPSLSPLSETLALTGILECVAATGTPVHLMRIATARGVDLIRQAKANGLPISTSVTWMHLLHNTTDLATYHPALSLNPPVGNPEDQEALLQGLEQGILDAIAVDHRPYTYEEKHIGFGECPPGAIGLELAFPLLWQQLVTPGRWSPAVLWEKLSLAPLRCLNRSLPRLSPGQSVALTLFAPEQTWVVEASSLKSKSSNTPWMGETVCGQVQKLYA